MSPPVPGSLAIGFVTWGCEHPEAHFCLQSASGVNAPKGDHAEVAQAHG
jgi:hypothetical protein